MKKPHLTIYEDGTLVRWHNRKTIVKASKEGSKDVLIQFSRFLEPGEDPDAVQSISIVIRKKVKVTGIKLTRQGAEMLLQALFRELER